MFPSLALLDEIFVRESTNSYEDVLLVCVQHLLETTGSLLEKCIDLGFEKKNIHVLGKIYSTSPAIKDRLRRLGVVVHESGSNFRFGHYAEQLDDDVERMWAYILRHSPIESIRRIIVLDDGGANIAAVPRKLVAQSPIVGVEQTMSGISMNRASTPAIPFIGVGSSAAKLLIEPQIIKEAIFARVLQRSAGMSGVAGVVGAGYIGRVVAKGLRTAGLKVLVHDKDEQRLDAASEGIICESLQELYEDSDTVWGCTGVDHLAGCDWFANLKGAKTLISCSSKDSEFRSALRLLDHSSLSEEQNRLSDVDVETAFCRLRILRGGFPINFDGSPESAPSIDIQLTRALLLAGILQAATVRAGPFQSSAREIELNFDLQARIVRTWFDLNPSRQLWYDSRTLEVFADFAEELAFIDRSSGTSKI
jgi:S-adenosylhomocysteine hydrolase